MKSGIYADERMLVTDNTSLAYWRACPRKWYWKVQSGLTHLVGDQWGAKAPPKTPVHLQFGTAIHAGLDVLYDTWNVADAQAAFQEKMEGAYYGEEKVRTLSRGLKVLEDYHTQWHAVDQEWKLLQAEASFTFDMPVHVPEEGTPWTIRYHGKVDKIMVSQETGHFQIRDHKTTKFAPTSRIDAYALSNQGLGYLNGLATLLGESALERSEMLFDIILLNPKNTKFIRTLPVQPYDYLMRQFRTGITSTASQIIYTFLQAKTENAFEHFPMFAPEPCSMFNSQCEFWNLCDALNPESVKRKVENAYIYDPWDPEER